MAKVRSQGNLSTEKTVESTLRGRGVSGWVKHPKGIEGKPDFYFPEQRLLLFVDGCFWHGCPRCGRIPKSRVAFWQGKIEANRRRDQAVRRDLRARGFRVIRIWEHDAKGSRWIARLQYLLTEPEPQGRVSR